MQEAPEEIVGPWGIAFRWARAPASASDEDLAAAAAEGVNDPEEAARRAAAIAREATARTLNAWFASQQEQVFWPASGPGSSGLPSVETAEARFNERLRNEIREVAERRKSSAPARDDARLDMHEDPELENDFP